MHSCHSCHFCDFCVDRLTSDLRGACSYSTQGGESLSLHSNARNPCSLCILRPTSLAKKHHCGKSITASWDAGATTRHAPPTDVQRCRDILGLGTDFSPPCQNVSTRRLTSCASGCAVVRVRRWVRFRLTCRTPGRRGERIVPATGGPPSFRSSVRFDRQFGG